jgi:phosphatidylserine/phosphatidylglycerophosphate/cardiolipin synthase-like enzyme
VPVVCTFCEIGLLSRADGSLEHMSEHHSHDLYAEVAGPAATGLHHNFIQRWNEASERTADDGVGRFSPFAECRRRAPA